MVVDPARVLLAKVLFFFDFGEVGVEAFLVALFVEGIHSGLTLSFLLPNLIVFDLSKRGMIHG